MGFSQLILSPFTFSNVTSNANDPDDPAISINSWALGREEYLLSMRSFDYFLYYFGITGLHNAAIVFHSREANFRICVYFCIFLANNLLRRFADNAQGGRVGHNDPALPVFYKNRVICAMNDGLQ